MEITPARFFVFLVATMALLIAAPFVGPYAIAAAVLFALVAIPVLGVMAIRTAIIASKRTRNSHSAVPSDRSLIEVSKSAPIQQERLAAIAAPGSVMLQEQKIDSRNQEAKTYELGLSDHSVETNRGGRGEPVTDRNDPLHALEGVLAIIHVYADKIVFRPRKNNPFTTWVGIGTKTIPFSSIRAVEFREVGTWRSGYIRFTVLGANGGESGRIGIDGAVHDENSFFFSGKENNESAAKICRYVEDKLLRRGGSSL